MKKPTISPAKAAKCAQWLAAQGVRGCPLCGGAALSAADVVAAPVMDPVTQMAQRQVMPVVAVECGRCLHVMFFNAVKMGLMGKDDA